MRIRKVAPWPYAESTVAMPPCAWAMAATIARPSPEPSSPRPGCARPNRSKMRCWSSAAMPMPSSRTHSRSVSDAGTGVPSAAVGPFDPGAERDRGGRLGVLDGVRGELDQGLGEALRVRVHHEIGLFIDLPMAVGQDVHFLHHLVQKLRDPDGLAPDEAGVAGVGQQQEVVHKALHPVHLVQQHLPRGNDILRVIDRLQFEVPAEDGQWSTQLMAGVVQELLLLLGALIQPFQHGVEGLGEQGDVVLALAHLHALRKVLLADRTGGLAQPAERIEQPAGNDAANHRGRQERAEGHQRIRPHGVDVVLVLIARVPADQEESPGGYGGALQGTTTARSGPPSALSSAKAAPAASRIPAASANIASFKSVLSRLPSTVHATRPSTIPAMTSLLRGSRSSAASWRALLAVLSAVSPDAFLPGLDELDHRFGPVQKRLVKPGIGLLELDHEGHQSRGDEPRKHHHQHGGHHPETHRVDFRAPAGRVLGARRGGGSGRSGLAFPAGSFVRGGHHVSFPAEGCCFAGTCRRLAEAVAGAARGEDAVRADL